MVKSKAQYKFITLIILAGLILGVVGTQAFSATTTQAQTPRTGLAPQVSYPIKHDVSPALSSIKLPPRAPEGGVGEVSPRFTLPKSEEGFKAAAQGDRAVQNAPVEGKSPAPAFNFDGVTNINGVLPPDTNGDVGPNHYVQWVNLSMAIWTLDRNTNTATLVYGPSNGNAVFAGFGGACESTNDGDPIVLYDHLADRWFISQFAFPNFPSGPYVQCMAVSQTPDPTGAWYRYGFTVSNTKMNDYPHFGVWPDGYYMTINQFTNASSWGGAAAVVYERDKMLLGQTARQVYFDLFSVSADFGGMLPSDLDGDPPPAGTPNFFAEVDDSSWIPPVDAMRIWEFHVDWVNTANSTFGLSGMPNTTLPVTNFDLMSGGIPQPGTGVALDTLADRLMHRLQYRNFGSYETLVTNHTVNSGGGRAGVRWYDVRRPTGGAWAMNQQGTYAGDTVTTDHRWMASVAMDAAGNIGAGYSISSGTRFPSIAYTGRLDGDPLGALPQGEVIMHAGTGSQTHSASRWGDYSMLGVDPVDGCTFWFTTEYVQTTGSAPWRTRIGSFTFPSCLTGLKGSLAGNVSDGVNPIPLATIDANGFTGATNSLGDYDIADLIVGSYTVTASAYGFAPETINNVTIEFNTITTLDFVLAPIPLVTVSGVVTDGSGQGWPLYARIDIAAPGHSETVFTDPATGAYSVELVAGVEHSFTINAVGPGYSANNATVTPAFLEMTQNFTLAVDAGTCTAPGYELDVTCNTVPGALLVGNVYDENTGAALNGATVTSVDAPADTTDSFATAADPAQDDGFFILFSSLTGTHDFTATETNYGTRTHSVALTAGTTTGQDFQLPAGRLQASPASFTESLGATQVITRVVTLSNIGSQAANFTLAEVNAPDETLTPTGPFAKATRRVGPKRLAEMDANRVYNYIPPSAPVLSGGAVLGSWNSGLTRPWGVGVDGTTGDVWLGNVAAGGGDDRLHRFTSTGSATGQSIDVASASVFSADLAYNPFTRTFWQVSVAGDNCMVEIDPAAGTRTGRKICAAFDQSQRGLAFNPLNGSFYSGSWTSGIIYHFDQNGVILDSVNVDLNIAGLAFNPDTRRLFVLSNASVGYDVYVLDTENNYAILGGFDIPGLGSFEQAGLEMTCDGHLWAVNQVTGVIYEADSGESTACAYADVPWLTAAPVAGTVGVTTTQEVVLTIDAAAALAGGSTGRIVVSSNTPYGSINVPVNITVAPRYAVGLNTASTAKTGTAGTIVTYVVQITNNGNTNDIFSIGASGNTWTVTKPTQAGPLLPGGSTNINVNVLIPTAAAFGAHDTVVIRVTSVSNPTVFTTLTLNTSVPGFNLFLPALKK